MTTPAHIITQPFGAAAVDPEYITLPIPVPSQISVEAGAASFEDGFPPSTMTDLEAGGAYPLGEDFNGIFYMLSAYCAMLQAGQRVNWNVDAATAFTGYAVGAKVDSITTPGRVWTNNLAGNATDPDVDSTNWVSSTPLPLAVALSGAQNNYALPGPSDFRLDVDTTAGACDFSGFVAQRDGQRLYISQTGANMLQVLALSGLSAAGNQVRVGTDLGFIENMTLTLQYFAGINKWLSV